MKKMFIAISMLLLGTMLSGCSENKTVINSSRNTQPVSTQITTSITQKTIGNTLPVNQEQMFKPIGSQIKPFVFSNGITVDFKNFKRQYPNGESEDSKIPVLKFKDKVVWDSETIAKRWVQPQGAYQVSETAGNVILLIKAITSVDGMGISVYVIGIDPDGKIIINKIWNDGLYDAHFVSPNVMELGKQYIDPNVPRYKAATGRWTITTYLLTSKGLQQVKQLSEEKDAAQLWGN